MAFEIPKQAYCGNIGITKVGTGAHTLPLGGSEVYPFYLFEGKIPNAPRIAMEIWDYDPSGEWPAAAVAPFMDVISSPAAWARKCVDEYGADLIVLQLKSTDPNGMDRSAAEATEVAMKVLAAVEVPLIFWGTANNQKDEEVLKRISQSCQGRNVGLSPVEEGNYKAVGASALAYGHTIVASSPIDVNLAKQLNILLSNLGVPLSKVIIDPTTGGLGYGMEYSYSVIERIRVAALTQEDEKLQAPIISNVGNEVWKSKEAGQPAQSAPALGDAERRGVLMETVAAVCYLLAGADVVILRHPESVRLVRSFIGLMINGGAATGVKEIAKRLRIEEQDFIATPPAEALSRDKETAPAGDAGLEGIKPGPGEKKMEKDASVKSVSRPGAGAGRRPATDKKKAPEGAEPGGPGKEQVSERPGKPDGTPRSALVDGLIHNLDRIHRRGI